MEADSAVSANSVVFASGTVAWSPRERQSGREGGCKMKENKNKLEPTARAKDHKDRIKPALVLIASDLAGVDVPQEPGPFNHRAKHTRGLQAREA